jgi:hypothetical protein
MRSMKKFGLLAVLALAISAIGVASASAATFTASATGSLSGVAKATQVFTTNGGTVSCNNAATSGTIEKTADVQQHVTVIYSGCTAFGFASVHITPATYQFTSNGQVHIKNTISITPTFFGASICTTTVGPQTVGTVDYANSGANNVLVTPTVTKIKYTSTGGACGASGENGTYTGANETSRVGGGTLRFDP